MRIYRRHDSQAKSIQRIPIANPTTPTNPNTPAPTAFLSPVPELAVAGLELVAVLLLPPELSVLLDPLPVAETVEIPDDTDALLAEDPEDEAVVEADLADADEAVEEAVEDTDSVEGKIVPDEPAPSWTASWVGLEIWSDPTHVPSCKPACPGRQQKYSATLAVSIVAFHRDQLSSAQYGVTWKAEMQSIAVDHISPAYS